MVNHPTYSISERFYAPDRFLGKVGIERRFLLLSRQTIEVALE